MKSKTSIHVDGEKAEEETFERNFQLLSKNKRFFAKGNKDLFSIPQMNVQKAFYKK